MANMKQDATCSVINGVFQKTKADIVSLPNTHISTTKSDHRFPVTTNQKFTQPIVCSFESSNGNYENSISVKEIINFWL